MDRGWVYVSEKHWNSRLTSVFQVTNTQLLKENSSMDELATGNAQLFIEISSAGARIRRSSKGLNLFWLADLNLTQLVS